MIEESAQFQVDWGVTPGKVRQKSVVGQFENLGGIAARFRGRHRIVCATELWKWDAVCWGGWTDNIFILSGTHKYHIRIDLSVHRLTVD